MKYDYLIIGGGIAGTAAADMIRKYDTEGSLGIVSSEPYPLYSRISLSKESFFLGGKSEKEIFIKSKKWYTENNITTIFNMGVNSLDTQKKDITFSDNTHVSYSKLLLALGGAPIHHEADVGECSGIYYFRDLFDARAILKRLSTSKKVVLVGCGFISFEMADLLRKKNVDVSAVYNKKYYWEQTLDATAGQMVERALIKKGVHLFSEKNIISFNGTDSVTDVTLSDGNTIDCDMVICGLGVDTRQKWVEIAGIQARSGVRVNEFLESSSPHIWSAGDSAEFKDVILNNTHRLGNWVNAQMQGRAAGYNMTHDVPKPYTFISSYTSTGAGLTVSFIGDVRHTSSTEILSRGPLATTYGQLFIDDSKLKGAVLINRGHEINPLSRLITHCTDISHIKNDLTDPHIDLKMIF